MPQGISMHIGLNHVDQSHYTNEKGEPWNGELHAPVSDARAMQKLAASQGFSTHLVLNHEATTQRLISEITRAAQILRAGDIFLLTYSGHGSQTFDQSGDEPLNEMASAAIPQVLGKDETLCLYDRHFKDDELNQLLGKFAANVRVLVVADCCHSGSNIRDIDESRSEVKTSVRGVSIDVTEKVIARNQAAYADFWGKDTLKNSQRIACSVILLSACQDSQEALELTSGGVFTTALIQVWNNGHFNGSYPQFRNEIIQEIKRMNTLYPNFHINQVPNYLTDGAPNASFVKQKPFTI